MKVSKKWLKDKVHVYYFVVLFFTGLTTGIIASLYTDENTFKNNFWLILGLGLFVPCIIRLRRLFLIFIFISGLFFGIWRSSNYEFSKGDFNQYIGKNVVLHGKVVDDISHGKNGDTRFKLKKIVINGESFNGEIWASTRESQVIKRSDLVEVEGKLSKGFGSFFASMSGVDVVEVTKESNKDLGLQIRDNFADATKNSIDEPERSLGLGFLLGQKNDLPEDLQNQIKLLGLSHIVVASGYNLTILVAFARKIFAKISKYLSAVTGASMIAGFILITGFSPSMSRAGLVAGLSLLAWYYGRKIHPGVLLLVSAGITLMIKPSYIWGDLGWYLSFLAFIGILILAPLLHHYFWGVPDLPKTPLLPDPQQESTVSFSSVKVSKDTPPEDKRASRSLLGESGEQTILGRSGKHKKPSWIRELLVATFSAQLMTLPILLYSFGSFSFYSIIANAFVLPVIPFAMVAVFVAGLASLLMPIFANIFSIPAIWLLKYCTFVIDKISAFPSVATELDINFFTMSICYGALALLIIMLKLRTKHNFLKDKMIID